MKQPFKLLLMLAAIAMWQQAPAQKQGPALIDSMLQVLRSDKYRSKEDTDKVRLLFELSSAYQLINPDEGIVYGQQSLQMATRLGWKKGMAGANNILGVNYKNKNEYAKAMDYYLQAKAIYEEAGSNGIVANVIGNIGALYFLQSDYEHALEYYLKAIKILEDAHNDIGAAKMAMAIGTIYYTQNDYPKALEYYFRQLKTYEKENNRQGIADITCNIGDVYFKMNDYRAALGYFDTAIKTMTETGSKNGLGIAEVDIAETYMKLGSYSLALADLQNALQTGKETGNRLLEAAALNDLGHIYISLITDTAARTEWTPDGVKDGKGVIIPKSKAALLQTATTCLLQSLELSKQVHAGELTLEVYENLAEACRLGEDYKLSLGYYKNYVSLRDSVFSQANNEKIVKMELKNEYDKKTAAVQKADALKLQRQRTYTRMGVAGILLLLVFAFFITRNYRMLTKEKQRSENLLLNILPGEVAAELKETGASAARHYDDVTVLFADFVNFTTAAERMSPQALIDELHACFRAFDEITGRYAIEKIKTIGDAYLAACGLPAPNVHHAENTVRAAKEIISFMQERAMQPGISTFQVRIGIHSGSVVAGIVGVKKFAYDIWGDTVNTAARMEQSSEPGRINISATTYEQVKDKFNCNYRGAIAAKNKGELNMYFVS